MKWLIKFKQALRALSPSCREAVRLQSAQMDHPLGCAQRIGLKIHLFLCRWCRRYGVQIRFLRTASRNQPEPEPATTDQQMPADVRERLRRKLQDTRK